jgi:hypothetical protein
MIFKLKIVKPNSAEQDIDTLRSICFEKFFRITEPDSKYIREEKGRPFNFLTTVIRNHLIGHVQDIRKRKTKIETNYFDSEEYVFTERINHLGDPNYDEIVIDEEEYDACAVYNRLVRSLERDIETDAFNSKKEKAFAEQLLVVLRKIDHFDEFGWFNKFFIKLILQEITGLEKHTVNYYLAKIKRRYINITQD